MTPKHNNQVDLAVDKSEKRGGGVPAGSALQSGRKQNNEVIRVPPSPVGQRPPSEKKGMLREGVTSGSPKDRSSLLP
jgi:hypothetical protein